MPENIPDINTSVFAHGIKNRLSFIRSKLQLMELENNEKGAFDSIYRELDGINESVCQLISAPKKTEKTLFNVKDAIYECILEKLPEANLNGITIRRKLEDNLFVSASEADFRECIINILKNAVEACPPKGGEIYVSSCFAGDTVEITVSDNGKGISRKDAKNIFTPFFTTKEKGSGIGLFSCRKFARESGGSLSISGSPGKGACVKLILPKADCNENT